MTSTRRLHALGLVLPLALALFGGWACGGESTDADPTPVQTFKITPADGASTPLPTSEPVVTAAPTEPDPAETAPGGTTTITIAGLNSEFDVEEVEAPAGMLTIVFDNRDSGVVHNLHVHRGSDNDGETVAETELEVGPNEQTVTFEVAPGEYYYVCDAHPTTMEGTLVVN